MDEILFAPQNETMVETITFVYFQGNHQKPVLFFKVETIVGWYLQGNAIIPGFLRWCEMDFGPPQYVKGYVATTLGVENGGSCSLRAFGEKVCDWLPK